MSNSKFFFILGGDDAEMSLVAALLAAFGIPFSQPEKGWGDHVFQPEQVGLETGGTPVNYGMGACGSIPCVKFAGVVVTPVFVECRPAKGWPGDVVVVDHHNDRSGEPAAVRQVIDLLGLWPKLSPALQRWAELIAANDAGYIPAMLALGATADEVSRVRLADRSAQGITPAHEVEAERAIAAREVSGRLTVVRMAHSKCATISDRLFGAVDQLLILSEDGEVNFFGDGALCAALKEKFQGWSGGSGLGHGGGNAFWGGYPPHEEVAKFIRTYLNS